MKVVPGERGGNKKVLSCPCNHSLAVVCFRANIEAHIGSNVVSVKWLPSDDLL